MCVGLMADAFGPQFMCAGCANCVGFGPTIMRAGCNKEQYREKFGALPTYTLLTAPVKPALQSGFVVAKVRTAGRPGK